MLDLASFLLFTSSAILFLFAGFYILQIKHMNLKLQH